MRTIVWTAIDDCGNSSFCVQTIQIIDSTPPVVICPPNYNGICTDINIDFGSPIVTDNCSVSADITVTSNDVINNPDPCTIQIIRTWIVMDFCQNTTTCSQIITLVDTTSPVIVCPPEAIGECDQISDLFGMATATDDCTDTNDIVITYTDIYTLFDPCSAKIQRIWTATDDCLNSSSCTQNIYLYDTTPPVVFCPADAIGDCTQIGDNFGTPIVSDNCNSTTINYFDQISYPDPCTTIVTRMWGVSDACNNFTNCTQIITLYDNIFPVISCPPNATGDCTQINDNFGTATATDNCTNVTITNIDVLTYPNPCTTLITRTWFATDECTNTSSCVQTITLSDTAPPVITCPIDTEGTCDPNENFGTATAVDNCDPSPIISFSDQLIANSNCDYTLLRTWTATDACGLSNSCIQTITLVDNTPPVIVCPPDITLECDASQNYGTATAADFCSQNVTLSYLDEVTGDLCSATITRVWIASDDCNNISTCSQVITIVDTTPPVITCPLNVNNVQCDFLLGLGVANALDNCTPIGEILINYTEVISNGGTCNYTIVRTWTAEDYCGNISSCVQTIGVVDNVPPVIVCPPDVVMECGETTFYGDATATDNCQDNVSLIYTDVITGNVCTSGGQLITRTWSADDGCGNTSTCIQNISLYDTTAPVIYCPDDMTVWANIGASGANVPFVVTATDLCDPSVQIICDSNSGDYFPCNQATLVICTATDACGNTDVCSFSIIVNCVTVICHDIYAVIDLSGGGLTTLPTFIASNGCGEDEDIVLAFPEWPEDNYFTEDTTMITVIGTDECGNFGSCDFNVILDSINNVMNASLIDKQVHLFPNPAKDHISIKFDFTPNSMDLLIYDSSGRIVLKEENKRGAKTQSLDISNLISGLYFIQISNEQFQIRKKLIVK